MKNSNESKTVAYYKMVACVLYASILLIMFVVSKGAIVDVPMMIAVCALGMHGLYQLVLYIEKTKKENRRKRLELSE